MKAVTMADRLDDIIESAPAEGALMGEMWAAAYDELKQLARGRLWRSGRRTLLDTTSLVNEAYLRCAGRQRLSVEHRGAFFAYSARTMRSVIVDLAREARAHWHQGDLQKITLDTDLSATLASADDDPLQVNDALIALAEVEPRLAQVVEMRFFGGFTELETALALGLSDRTVRRDWERARLLLAGLLDR